MRSIDNRLLITIFIVTLFNGQVSEAVEVQFNSSVSCPGETLYATCSSGEYVVSFLWELHNSTELLQFVATSAFSGATLSSSDGDFTATLDRITPDPSGRNLYLFSSTLAIAGNVNNTNFFCSAGTESLISSPVFTITRFGTPSSPENLRLNGCSTLAWDRPEYTASGFSHFLVSSDSTDNGMNITLTDGSLTVEHFRERISISTIDQCGQASAPIPIVIPATPKLSNPKVALNCSQPLDEPGRQSLSAGIRMQVKHCPCFRKRAMLMSTAIFPGNLSHGGPARGLPLTAVRPA